jgi:formylmethanofuran dehydrogenase subunit A
MTRTTKKPEMPMVPLAELKRIQIIGDDFICGSYLTEGQKQAVEAFITYLNAITEEQAQ